MKSMTKFASLSALPMLVALAGCGSGGDAAAPESDAAAQTDAEMAGGDVATASLKTADGADAGTATVMSHDGALMVTVNAKGLPAGEHGTHIHMTGKCDGPDFKSAGGHWNPNEKMHGLENPEGQHAGDMPNLVASEDGTGTLEYTLKGATTEQLLDADGSAIVIHAGADDQKTDPSGDSGDRLACGVFAAG